MNNFREALFAMKITETNAAKVTWGVNHFSREMSVKSHFGEYCVNHWAVDFVKDVAGDRTGRERVCDGR